MKLFKASDLLDELSNRTTSNIQAAEQLKTCSLEQLNQKPHKEAWSVLECIEHLNKYSDFYHPEISKRMQASVRPVATFFKSSLLGNYFANSMKPREKPNNMKTFNSMNPAGKVLDVAVLEKFMADQQQLLALLERARTLDLTKVKTSTSISSWIKLRLGDTFRVVIYHNWRHIVQAERVVQSMQ